MKKGRPYARTTITVPVDLKRRMKKTRHAVNWSSVACRAFEAKLKELAEKGETMTLRETVTRLRKLKQGNAGTEAQRSGQRSGREWAMTTADIAQLERLDEFRTKMTDSEWHAFCESDEAWRELARQIEPWTESKPARQKKFWKIILGDAKGTTPEFFRGFAEGAVDVWHEVRDQL